MAGLFVRWHFIRTVEESRQQLSMKRKRRVVGGCALRGLRVVCGYGSEGVVNPEPCDRLLLAHPRASRDSLLHVAILFPFGIKRVYWLGMLCIAERGDK